VDRRLFLRLSAGSGLGFLGLSLTGCGDESSAKLAADSLAAQNPTVMMTDIRIIALYSDGTFGPVTGVLRVEDIVARRPVTLDHWDSHGHKFTIALEHHAALKRGEKIKIKTTIAQSHDHLVLVDPANHVPGAQPVAVPLENNQTLPPDARMFIALDESGSPRLFASSAAQLDQESMRWCLDTVERCKSDPMLWKALRLEPSRAGIFGSQVALDLSPMQREYTLVVRAKRLIDGQMLENAFRLIAKP
jgi:hypothetical protein